MHVSKRLNELCDEFEDDWKAGRSPDVAATIARVGRAERRIATVELVCIDVTYRLKRGRTPDLTDYAHLDVAHHTLVRAFDYAHEHMDQPESSSAPGIAGYELFELVGHGGMARVYRARKDQSERDVALKVIGEGLPGTSRWERFRREIGAVERIYNEHVVPIYDFGEHDGRLFFTMRLVHGLSLQQLFEGVSPQAELIVSVLRQLAAGLYAAHQQQVVHRDLTPNNILVEDTDGPTVRIVDFGLAATLDRANSLTATDHVLGTLGYLAPELARGQTAPDVRMDVYGFGAVMYFLMTGRPPVSGTSAAEWISNTVTVDPVQPQKLRPGIATDLATICMKCLEKNPSARYSTIGAVDAELAAWQQGRRIAAQPPNRAQRAYKVVRRRPTVSMAIVSVIVVLLAAAITLTFKQDSDRANEGQLIAEQKQQAAIEKQIEILDGVWNRLDVILAGNVSGKKRRELLTAAMQEAEAVRKELWGLDTTTRLNRSLASAHVRLGRIYLRIGGAGEESGTDLAIQEFKLAYAEFEERRKQHPADNQRLRDVWVSSRALGEAQLQLGKPEEALRYYERGLQLLRQAEAETRESKRDLAAALDDVGRAQLGLGLFEASKKSFEAALKIRESFEENQSEYELSVSYRNVGDVLMKLGLTAQAAEHFHRAKLAIDREAERQPKNTRVQHGRWVCRYSLSKSLNQLGDFKQQIDLLTEAIQICEQLLFEDSGNRQFQRDKCMSEDALGLALQALGKRDEARKAFEAAASSAERLSADDFRDERSRLDVSIVYFHVGDFFRIARDFALAEKAFVNCQSYVSATLQNAPKNREATVMSARAVRGLADINVARKHFDQAAPGYDECLKLLRELQSRDDVEVLSEIGHTHECVGVMSQLRGDSERAREAFEACCDIRRRLTRIDSGNARRKAEFAYSLANLGVEFLTAGKSKVAETVFQEALDVFKPLAKDNKLTKHQMDAMVRVEALRRRAKEGN